MEYYEIYEIKITFSNGESRTFFEESESASEALINIFKGLKGYIREDVRDIIIKN